MIIDNIEIDAFAVSQSINNFIGMAVNQIAELFNKDIKYGNIHYEIDISDKDLESRSGFNLDDTSKDNIQKYITNYE